MIYYMDARHNIGVALTDGPSWHKAWQTAINTRYMSDKTMMPVLLLYAEEVDGENGEKLKTVYQSPYKKHITENYEHVEKINPELSTRSDTQVG